MGIPEIWKPYFMCYDAVQIKTDREELNKYLRDVFATYYNTTTKVILQWCQE